MILLRACSTSTAIFSSSNNVKSPIMTCFLGLVAFTADGQRILTTQTDRSVGGRFFDDRLARHFMEVFNSQHRSKGVRLTPDTHPKVFAKLLNVAEKVKRQMSANRNTLPVVVECLANDLDLITEISRQQFEHLCADLFERVRNCFFRLIQRSRLERGSLHSVEIFGGSSRIPLFKSLVEEVFGVQPSTTLNADEAVARGCALLCALNTKVFKVRPFQILDTVHYTTQVRKLWMAPIVTYTEHIMGFTLTSALLIPSISWNALF